MGKVDRLMFVASLAIAVAGPLPAQRADSLEAVFNRASAALQAGDYPRAQEGFDRVLLTDPRNVAALADLGVLYSRTHRYARAVDVYQRALALEPNDPAIVTNLGLVKMKQGDYPGAQTYFAQLVQADGKNVRAVLLLASCMILGDAPERGLELLQSRHLESGDASLLTLEAVAYVRLNRRNEADALLRQMLAAGGTRAQANFLLGESLHDGHQLAEAADAFQQTLQQDPAYPGAHRELGKVLISMQEFSGAERELRTALEQDGSDAEAAYFLGALLVQTGREPEGVPYLQRAEKAMPDSWAIPFYLGKARLAQKQPAEAVPLLERAASMNADEPQVFYVLAGALRSSGQVAAAKQAMARVQELHSTALDAEKQSMERRVAVVR